MRESRRAASRSIRDASVASSTSAARRLDIAAVSNARTGAIAGAAEGQRARERVPAARAWTR